MLAHHRRMGESLKLTKSFGKTGVGSTAFYREQPRSSRVDQKMMLITVSIEGQSDFFGEFAESSEIDMSGDVLLTGAEKRVLSSVVLVVAAQRSRRAIRMVVGSAIMPLVDDPPEPVGK